MIIHEHKSEQKAGKMSMGAGLDMSPRANARHINFSALI
uniref:Uncharacterized protein n=1 Tax=Setaria italica TaxID=4555 RepID=K3Y4K2_SETIT